MADFSVAGRKFRTQADYRAALKDQEQIEAIKKQVDMAQPGEVLKLWVEISSGKYSFKTLVGSDFKEEISELAEKYKKQGYTRDSKVKTAKSKSSPKKAKKNGKKPTKSKAAASLEDYDEKMQAEIKAVLKSNERKRKFLIAICGIIAIGCFGYYGVYYYFADKTQSNYDDLADLKGSKALAAQNATIHYTDDEDVELSVLSEYETLYNKNKRLIGWLTIDNTEPSIDYPVMQTTNNELVPEGCRPGSKLSDLAL